MRCETFCVNSSFPVTRFVWQPQLLLAALFFIFCSVCRSSCCLLGGIKVKFPKIIQWLASLSPHHRRTSSQYSQQLPIGWPFPLPGQTRDVSGKVVHFNGDFEDHFDAPPIFCSSSVTQIRSFVKEISSSSWLYLQMARIIRKSHSPASVARGAIIQLLTALLVCYWRGCCNRSTHLKKTRMVEFVENSNITWVGQSLCSFVSIN